MGHLLAAVSTPGPGRAAGKDAQGGLGRGKTRMSAGQTVQLERHEPWDDVHRRIASLELRLCELAHPPPSPHLPSSSTRLKCPLYVALELIACHGCTCLLAPYPVTSHLHPWPSILDEQRKSERQSRASSRRILTARLLRPPYPHLIPRLLASVQRREME